MNSFSCVITGHRPTRFKFKYNEKDKRCQRIKKCLQEQLIRLYNQGVRCFWAGGAMGADMWASEILLHMKEQTALMGAAMLLLDKEKLPEAERLAAAAQTVDLASDAFFKECYMEGMLF